MSTATLPAPAFTPSPFTTIKPDRSWEWVVPYDPTTGTGCLRITVTTKRGEVSADYLLIRLDADDGTVKAWRLVNMTNKERYDLPAEGGLPCGCQCGDAHYRKSRWGEKCKHERCLYEALTKE